MDERNGRSRSGRRIAGVVLGGIVLLCGRCLSESDSAPRGPSREDFARFLRSENPHSRAYAVYNVAYRVSEDAGRLVPFISDGDAGVRRAAIFCLGLLRFEPGTERFIEALKDPHYGVRRAAVFALGNIKTPGAIEGLSQALQDSDSVARQLAILGIARSGEKAYAPKLVSLLKDESPRVRRAAACALGMLGDASALEPLRRLYRDRKCSEPGQRVALVNGRVREALAKKVNLNYKFLHFMETVKKLSEAAEVEIRVDDEVLFRLNTSASDPENLNSIKLAMWEVRLEKALRKVAETVGAHYYVESGTINIASRSYAAYDTPVRLEVAAAMALLGDRSALGEVRKFTNHPRFGKRAQELLRAAGRR